MSESVDALAEKVRGCLNDRDGMTFNGARRALDALLARLAEAERERDLLREEIRIREESQIPMIPRAASERLKAAEEERDIAREQAANHLARLLDERKAAEARLAEAEKREDWMRRQIDGCIDTAEAILNVGPFAIARALVLDLRDARAALDWRDLA